MWYTNKCSWHDESSRKSYETCSHRIWSSTTLRALERRNFIEISQEFHRNQFNFTGKAKEQEFFSCNSNRPSGLELIEQTLPEKSTLIRPFETWHWLLPAKTFRHVLLDKGFLKKVKIWKKIILYLRWFICLQEICSSAYVEAEDNVTTGGGAMVPSVLGSTKPLTCSEVLNKKTVEKPTTEIQEKRN